MSLNNIGFDDDLVYVNAGNSMRRRSGDFTTSYNGNGSSRRSSRDITQEMQRMRNRLLQEIDVVSIPAGTRLHLWNDKAENISDAHFISTGDLNVLVRRGHGPMYRLIQQYIYPEDIPNKADTADLSQIWDETKDVFRSMPIVRNLVRNEDKVTQAISQLSSRFNNVDAVLMAYTHDGKVGLHFVEQGINPDISLFRE